LSLRASTPSSKLLAEHSAARARAMRPEDRLLVSSRSPADDFAEIRGLVEQPATPERLERIEALLLPHDSVAETRHRDDLIGAHAAMLARYRQAGLPDRRSRGSRDDRTDSK
jgi:hypothetical protein